MGKPKPRMNVPAHYRSKKNQPGTFYDCVQNLYPLSELRMMRIPLTMNCSHEHEHFRETVFWSKNQVKFGLVHPIQLRLVDKRSKHSYGRIAMILDVSPVDTSSEFILYCVVPPDKTDQSAKLWEWITDPRPGETTTWRACYNSDGEVTAIIVEMDGDTRNVFDPDAKEVTKNV